jgi:outer membrane lipoprotein carrier protein
MVQGVEITATTSEAQVLGSNKRRVGWLLAIAVACGSAQAARTGRAQNAAEVDPDAQTVAAAVQAFYDQTSDVSASFFQTYINKLYGRTDRSQGHVVFKKPGMMRWDYDQPNGKVIVSNGKKLLVYEPGDQRGEQGQVVEQNITAAQLPQAMAFLMGTGRLDESFTFRRLDAAREGYPAGDVLELRPKQPTPHYDRILFYVERTPALRGLVHRLLIIDSSGNRNRFDFSQLKFNGGVPGNRFDWQPPKNTRHVQM